MQGSDAAKQGSQVNDNELPNQKISPQYSKGRHVEKSPLPRVPINFGLETRGLAKVEVE